MENSLQGNLLVEDGEVDAMTVRRALKGLHGGNPLVRLENGKEAPGYLHFVDAMRATDTYRALGALPQ